MSTINVYIYISFGLDIFQSFIYFEIPNIDGASQIHCTPVHIDDFIIIDLHTNASKLLKYNELCKVWNFSTKYESLEN